MSTYPRSRRSRVTVLTAAAFAILAGTIAWSQYASESVRISQAVEHDVYAAGSDVVIDATIGGDLVVAGQRVTIGGNVNADVLAAAANIDINAPVNDDVRAAGQFIRIRAPVAGHVVAAGQEINIEQSVGDWAWLAAQTVTVTGRIGGELNAHGQTIIVNGEVAGDVELTGDALRIGPDAIIRGNLTLRSDNATDVSAEAQIDGVLTEEPLPDAYSEVVDGDSAVFFTLSLIVAVIALFLVFPARMRASAGRVAGSPGLSLLVGLAMLIGLPLLAILLMMSGIGVWLGLAVLGVFLLLLFAGVLTGLFAISHLVLRRFRPEPAWWLALLAIVLTVIAVGLISVVPWLGVVTVLAIWLFGTGALCAELWMLMRQQQPANAKAAPPTM